MPGFIKTLLLSFFTVILLGQCSTTIPLRKNYFKSASTVGYVIISTPKKIIITSSGGLGIPGAIVSASLTPEKKYDDILNQAIANVNPSQKTEKTYIDFFVSKGQKMIPISDALNGLKDFDSFSMAKGPDKYYRKDVRHLWSKYQIDQLLIIDLSYGLSLEYTFGSERAKVCFTEIRPQLIDLRDNSFAYRGHFLATQKILVPLSEEEIIKGLTSTLTETLTQQIAKYEAY